jgi:hypothetical protein
VVEQEAAPRSHFPLWDVSFGRKCRARPLIGCDGDHVLLQCVKLLGLKLSERKEILMLILPKARGRAGVLWARGLLEAQVHTSRLRRGAHTRCARAVGRGERGS